MKKTTITRYAREIYANTPVGAKFGKDKLEKVNNVALKHEPDNPNKD